MRALGKVLRRARRGRGRGNLRSTRDPYRVMVRLLADHRVTGILDAGAGYGRVSRRFLTLFPEARVFAFEPNPDYRQTLEALARGNPRFAPFFAALSVGPGEADLRIMHAPGNTSLFMPAPCLEQVDPEGTQLDRVVRTRTVSLDGWAAEQGLPPIQILKFDIQGAELQALEGATGILRKTVVLVYTEVLFNPLYQGGALFAPIDGFLREHGFVLHDLYKPKYHPAGRLLWGNAIYVDPDKRPPHRAQGKGRP